MDTAKSVYRPDIFAKAASALIAEELMAADQFPDFATESGFKGVQDDFLDGIAYDGSKPNEYLTNLKIGIKDEVQ